MNNTSTDTSVRVHEIITKGQNGAIVLSQNPSPDAIAAATSLYLGLTKLNKSVTLVCANPVQNDLIGTDKIQANLVTSGDNLVVSFPYTDGSIDKVDYNIQGDNFNLIIAPREGYAKLDPSQVKFAYTGGMLDFIITIDSPTLQSLGTVYTDNQTQFQGKDIINIDRHLTNSFYGTVNIVNKTASSVSEMILALLQNMRVEVDKDIATNLYAGIGAATNNFTSYSVNADTFETIAHLLRAGAVKKAVRKPQQQGFQQPRVQTQQVQRPVSQQQQSRPQQNQPQVVSRTVEFGSQETQKPIEDVEKENKVENPDNTASASDDAPQDWLKPKIFRGSGLI